MKNQVQGLYSTEKEVKEAVGKLKTEGIPAEEISIIANDSENTEWLRRETGVEADSDKLPVNKEYEEAETFWEKVKAAFKGEENRTGYHSFGYAGHFTKLGLSEEEAEKYDKEIRNGKIAVLAPVKR
ncbi:general stress protein [Evansella sp. LMS18]|uniref:general stress protein n=1 Tax=Evansella sp. LMS18 TaxID=2924033 RepID=UPI0020D00AA7|nr:general stress protein [Evansella sp. LMS18]UTR09956.1 general stress protein [Evansella sp. LMS18]